MMHASRWCSLFFSYLSIKRAVTSLGHHSLLGRCGWVFLQLHGFTMENTDQLQFCQTTTQCCCSQPFGKSPLSFGNEGFVVIGRDGFRPRNKQLLENILNFPSVSGKPLWSVNYSCLWCLGEQTVVIEGGEGQ